MGGIAIHYLAKTKLGIKTYENLSELHTQTNVPSCIKSVVIQSVITECVYFVITINMDASNGCVTIEFSLTTYSASQIRACRDDKVGVICNIKTKLYVNRQFKIELVNFHISISIYYTLIPQHYNLIFFIST